MNVKEIQKQLNSDYELFKNSKYDGNISVPEGIVDWFKTGIMYLSSYSHQILAYRIKAILLKDVNNLSYSDLEEIVKVILNTPLERLYPYKDLDEIIEICIKRDKFITALNNKVDNFKADLEMKGKKLMELSSGVGGNLNGMAIIN